MVGYLGRHGLIDEYRLMIYPVLVGAGKHLFDHSGPVGARTLKDSRSTESGVAILDLRPGGMTQRDVTVLGRGTMMVR